MARKRRSAEQLVRILREVEVALAGDATVRSACRDQAISEQAYYRWRREHGSLRTDQAKRMKALEKENLRLKRIVADQAVDLSILKEVAEGNF